MKNANDFYEESIEKWRKNVGKGTMVLNKQTDPKPIVLGIIQRIYNKSPCCGCIITVENFTQRNKLIEYITNTGVEENDKEIKKLISDKILRVYTVDFMNKYKLVGVDLFITLNNASINGYIIEFLRLARYKLTILNGYLDDTDIRLKLYDVNPILPGFDQNEINALRSSTPVEEIQIGVDITSESINEELAKCDKYITQSINIFGSFDVMNQCRVGNPAINMSAEVLCTRIAEENGWSDHMDMTIPINIQVDEMYNPNALRERARLVYDVIRRRSVLLSDYEGKLIEVVNIIREHKNENFLVISKRGEFAVRATEYINNFTTSTCGDYHDKLDSIPAVDFNGNPILYKSGINQGKQKLMGYQAQKTRNETLYNTDKLNCLSTSASPDKSLNIKVSNVIITSPMCDSIEQYIYRLSNVNFGEKISLWTIFVKNSMEQKLLAKKDITQHHQIVNNCEISADFDENLGVVFAE